jgi:hypothetical protein
MRTEIRYVENKESGEAWIGYCQFSKSGLSVYFNNKVLKRGQGISGNHFDIETGEEYWVSGVKKNGADRHWAEPGPVSLDRTAVDDYLKTIGLSSLPKNKFTLVDIINTPNKELSRRLENSKLEE